MQGLGIPFHGLPGSGGHDGLALVVNVEHQLLRLWLGIAEDSLEHVGHIAHQIDGIIPDNRDPWCIQPSILARFWLLNLDRRRAHCCHLPRTSVSHSPGESVARIQPSLSGPIPRRETPDSWSSPADISPIRNTFSSDSLPFVTLKSVKCWLCA